MVSTQQHHSLGVHDFESKEQKDHLQLLRAAIDPIPIEDVRGGLDVAGRMRREAIRAAQQQQREQLPVHVSEDFAPEAQHEWGGQRGLTCDSAVTRHGRPERRLLKRLAIVRLLGSVQRRGAAHGAGTLITLGCARSTVQQASASMQMASHSEAPTRGAAASGW